MPTAKRHHESRPGRRKGSVNKSTLILREILVELATNGHDPKRVVKRLADGLQQAPRLVAQLMGMMLEAEAQLLAKPPSPYPDSFPIITDEMTVLQAATAYQETLDFWHGQHAQGLMPTVDPSIMEQMDDATAARMYENSIANPPTWSDMAAKARGSKRDFYGILD